MSKQTIITASLEGMRVLIDEKRCQLQEFDFVANRWLPKETSPRPLMRPLAEKWLTGWNHLDRFTAMSALTRPPDYPAEAPRTESQLRSPRL